MRMTERVKEIMELNIVGQYIPLVVQADSAHLFPMYFGRIIGENTLVFPVTGATGIGEVLKQPKPTSAMVVDRPAGYEAYLLEGEARYVTSDEDYDLVSAMRNEAPAFPIDGAVTFEVRVVHLLPPP